MPTQHLTYFKVENFKRFDALELTDIGQFNLIVGDNNVGKTSLLEALAVTTGTGAIKDSNHGKDLCIDHLRTILEERGIYIDLHQESSYFLKFLLRNEALTGHFEWTLQGNSMSFEIQKSPLHASLMLRFQKKSEQEIKFENFSLLGLNTQTGTLPIVRTNVSADKNLPTAYQALLIDSRAYKQQMIENLRIIDRDIDDIDVLPVHQQAHVMIGFKSIDKYLPLGNLGDSAVRVFYLLLQILKNQGGILLIDEIDTGIHHTRMTRFLRQVVQLATKNNVQLFLTTHSLECQQMFAEVFGAPDMLEHKPRVRQYSLFEDKYGQIVASKRDWEQVQSALEIGYDTRGGVRG